VDEAAIWGKCKCVPDRKKFGALYVVVRRDFSLVVITFEKIKYHINSVGHDVLRNPVNINLTEIIADIFWTCSPYLERYT